MLAASLSQNSDSCLDKSELETGEVGGLLVEATEGVAVPPRWHKQILFGHLEICNVQNHTQS